MIRIGMLGVLMAGLGFLPLSLYAETYYVDQELGDDIANGTSAQANAGKSGPFRTIGRGFRALKEGDTLNIARGTQPYYESLILSGRLTKKSDRPIRIMGNGAVISGRVSIPEGAWEQERGGIWKFSPERKAGFLLFRNGQPLERSTELNPFQFMAEKGSFQLKLPSGIDANQVGLEYSGRIVGLTMTDVRAIEIFDLTFEHFQLDGISLHDRCKSVRLTRVQSRGNGGAGVHVAGSSTATLEKGGLYNNGGEHLLISEKAKVEVLDTSIGKPPVQPEYEPKPEEMSAEETVPQESSTDPE